MCSGLILNKPSTEEHVNTRSLHSVQARRPVHSRCMFSDSQVASKTGSQTQTQWWCICYLATKAVGRRPMNNCWGRSWIPLGKRGPLWRWGYILNHGSVKEWRVTKTKTTTTMWGKMADNQSRCVFTGKALKSGISWHWNSAFNLKLTESVPLYLQHVAVTLTGQPASTFYWWLVVCGHWVE